MGKKNIMHGLRMGKDPRYGMRQRYHISNTYIARKIKKAVKSPFDR